MSTSPALHPPHAFRNAGGVVYGLKARIPKGTMIASMEPHRKGERPSGREYVVSLQPIHLDGRWAEEWVTWAGSAGYWKRARLTDVELLNPPEDAA